jgi:hypothetical protein
MADIKGKSVVITIVPVTEAILMDVVQTLLVHVLDIQDHLLTEAGVISTVGNFAMYESACKAIPHKLAYTTGHRKNIELLTSDSECTQKRCGKISILGPEICKYAIECRFEVVANHVSHRQLWSAHWTLYTLQLNIQLL